MKLEDAIAAFPKITGEFYSRGDYGNVFATVMPLVIAYNELQAPLTPFQYRSVSDMVIGEEHASKLYKLVDSYIATNTISDDDIKSIKRIIDNLVSLFGCKLDSRATSLGYVSKKTQEKRDFKTNELRNELGYKRYKRY